MFENRLYPRPALERYGHVSYPVFFGYLLLLLLSFSSPLLGSEIQDFKSDGCSLFPDGHFTDRNLWCECCFVHDVAYWRGGSRDDRRQADETLRDCVLKQTEDRVLAKIMFEGVRAGGRPVFPTWYRWGYGWKYGRNYATLSDQELMQVAEKLNLYYKSNPEGYCAKSK